MNKNVFQTARRSFIAASAATIIFSVFGTAAHAAQDTLTIGLIPAEDSQAMIESSKQVIEQLERESGMKVEPFVATDYNGIIEALRAKKLDVAYLGPFSYVLASSVADVEAFAVAVTKKTGKSAYKSLIVVRADLPAGKKGTEADIVGVLGLVADFDDADAANYAARTAARG